MASIRKSFSLRNGVQVDDKNLIVNSNGLVGIGTSIPTEVLDVRGTAKVVGVVTATSIFATGLTISGVSTLSKLSVGITTISSGIITATSGVVTYYGDGGRLLNLPTSQWRDVDVGLGFTSIYAQGFVGVSTIDPRFVFQVGGNASTTIAGFANGVGINSTGNILATGIITASSFSGSGSDINTINASNISSGTLDTARLPSNINVSGIVTANTFKGTSFTGSLIGVANTANDITSNANIRVNSINSGFSTTGISTVYTRLLLPANQPLGIGTTNPSGDISIRRSGITSIVMITDGSFRSSIIFGRSISGVGNNAELRFGNTNGAYTDSTEKSLDIINYDTGNFNYYLHNGSVGLSTGNFNWIYGQDLSKLMTLTYNGKLGINETNPSNTLHVVGTSTVTQTAFFGGSISVLSNSIVNGIHTATTSISGIGSFGQLKILTQGATPTYPFQIGSNPNTGGGGVGMDAGGSIVTQGDYTGRNISASGIITATGAIIGASLNVSSGAISGGAISGSTGSFTSAITGSSVSVGSGSVSANSITVNQVTILPAGTAINQSGITTSFFFVPHMTTTQRNALTAAVGAMIYNTTTSKHQGYNGTSWFDFY